MGTPPLTEVPSSFETLVQLLRHRAASTPDRLVYTFLGYGEGGDTSFTFHELDRRARSIAADLQLQISPGDRVLLLYPPGLDYVAAFFGCLYANAIAVPVYLPRRNRPLSGLRAIVEDCAATTALSTMKVWQDLEGRLQDEEGFADLRWVLSDGPRSSSPDDWQEPEIEGRSLAFLQYTSGSTGKPKGVMLSHGNLLHNLGMITSCFEQGPDSVAVIWLPPYHDMGLIGGILQPLFGGSRGVLMSPASFFQRPLRWLEAISRFRATTSGGPNFAYDLCRRKITAEERSELDLSSWTVAFNGAEPISPLSMQAFADTFAESGFRHQAFRPCYGLAEGTLMVSGAPEARLPVTQPLDRQALLASEVLPAEIGPATQVLAGSGQPLGEQSLKIVDPATNQPCSADQVGEIWVSGPSVARGYWGQEALSREIFEAQVAGSEGVSYLRTGDLGFVRDGELFVTGRLKDLIIVRGRNYYPQDIEATVASSQAAFVSGGGAAFGLHEDGEEKLVVVQELERRAMRGFDALAAAAALRAAVAEHHQLQVYGIAFIRIGSLPKTSSGKVRRHEARRLYCEGGLVKVGEAVLDEGTNVDADPKIETPALNRELLLASEDGPQQLDAFLRGKIHRLLSSEGAPDDQPLTLLGMDSLLAVELQHEIEKALEVSIPFTALLDDITLAELRARILEQVAVAPVRHPETAEDVHGEGPATHTERALWFLQKLAPESAAYNLAAAVRLEPGPEVSQLRQVLGILWARHAALRTCFPSRNGQPKRLIHADLEPPLEVLDARGWTGDRLREHLEAQRHQAFDLEGQPPVRLIFCRTDAAPILFFNVHHILADFWSLTVLTRELGQLLDASLSGVKDLVRRFEDVPDGERFSPKAHARGEGYFLAEQGEALVDYWRAYLEGAPTVLDLPLDRARPLVQSFRGEVIHCDLDGTLMNKLRAICRQKDTTLYTLMLGGFAILLNRLSGQQDVLIGTPTANRGQANMAHAVSYLINAMVMRVGFQDRPDVDLFLKRLKRDVLSNLAHAALPFPYLVERLHLDNDLSVSPLFQAMFIYQKAPLQNDLDLTGLALDAPGTRLQMGDLTMQPVPLRNHTSQFDLTLVFGEGQGFDRLAFNYNSDLFDGETVSRWLGYLQEILGGIAAQPDGLIADLPLLGQREQHLLLESWNATEVAFEEQACIHEVFEARAKATPHKTALVFEDQVMSFGELEAAANRLANYLRETGLGLGSRVGVCLERSPEMVIALLATMKAGAAYVPLDPGYPVDRLSYILADAQAPVLLTAGHLGTLFQDFQGRVVALDQIASELGRQSTAPPRSGAGPTDLAYVIYTSGSTGKAKGVMLPHRAVNNFFAGMDEAVGCRPEDRLLAVTSISFDISVLELFWTLTRGCEVILLTDRAVLGGGGAGQSARPLDFGLFYFSSDASETGDNKYELLLEGARYADANGFSAVWTPERHFHAFGGLYPNPSVTGAALSTITENVRIRSGSVVLPLHHPIRVAEEWSVVDNLSGGRAEISIASGWQPNDFVLRPENYADRKRHVSEGIATLRKLWAGEAVEAVDGSGKTASVRALPRPIQKPIPIWYTSGGNPESFVEAARLGANLLTHLLGQTFEEMAEKIALYRKAREEAGFDPATGKVALMLHTYIGDDLATIRETTRIPFKDYLRSAFGLVTRLIDTMDLPFDASNMSEADREALLDFAFERYFNTAALFGTPESVQPLLEKIGQMGVDEVACLIDFGIDKQEVLAALPRLKEAMDLSKKVGRASTFSLEVQSRRHEPTILQCTPSTMRMLLHQKGAMESLGSLQTLMLGGEALPVELANELNETLSARLINMYGPTETAIWSTTSPVLGGGGVIPIGRPIANTRIYLVDPEGRLVPRGSTGELCIGGQGLARGYESRPALTAQKFVPDPFSGIPGARLYRTGDLARYAADGQLQFLGRLDFQVKLRGYRIELGEIEAALERHADIGEAVVIAHEQSGQMALVAYLVAVSGSAIPAQATLRRFLEETLPSYMVPAHFMTLERFPLTANGKVDRKSFPKPDAQRQGQVFVAPRGRIEQQVAEIWSEALGVEKVGAGDNFFDLGGHSLLMSQVHGRINETFGKQIPLVKMLELPTVSSLARFLSESGVETSAALRGKDRAQKQRQARRRQRRIAVHSES